MFLIKATSKCDRCEEATCEVELELINYRTDVRDDNESLLAEVPTVELRVMKLPEGWMSGHDYRDGAYTYCPECSVEKRKGR
jgi:hypothetical protein